MKQRKEQSKVKKIAKIIGLCILGLFLLMITAGIITMNTLSSCIKKEYKANETVIGSGEKKALLIYEPSKSDVAKEVSMSVAQTMKDAGYTVTINYPSKELTYDWKEYDVIALGSPVYFGTVSPALKKYVQRNPVENKKIFIYAVGMADDPKELIEMSSWISKNNNIVKTKCIAEDRETFIKSVEKTLTGWE